MNPLTIYHTIFTGQQLCLDALATPCRAQQYHSGSVRCTVSVFHFQVGQYYNYNSIVTSVSNLDYQLMNSLSLMILTLIAVTLLPSYELKKFLHPKMTALVKRKMALRNVPLPLHNTPRKERPLQMNCSSSQRDY